MREGEEKALDKRKEEMKMVERIVPLLEWAVNFSL